MVRKNTLGHRKMCTSSEGMCEVRWTGHGENKLQTSEMLFYSDKNEKRHEAGVRLLLSKKAANSLLEWNLGSDRIITARFESCFKVSIIMYYTPTNTSEEKYKNSFYAQLQSVIDKIPNQDMFILMGGMKAKLRSDKTDRERELGRHGLGEMNENGEMQIWRSLNCELRNSGLTGEEAKTSDRDRGSGKKLLRPYIPLEV